MNNIKIEEIDFSVRAWHCLKYSGIDTIEKLITFTEKDLIKIRNLGEKHRTEIISKVNNLGFEFKK